MTGWCLSATTALSVSLNFFTTGERASLDLDEWQFALLAGGTTLGVIAFTAVPGLVLRAQGIKWGPRWDLENPAVKALRGSVGWAQIRGLASQIPLQLQKHSMKPTLLHKFMKMVG
jgi:peptidoglycan biosynthesis protein MviN/MurJ (putative lipid II flippase)